MHLFPFFLLGYAAARFERVQTCRRGPVVGVAVAAFTTHTVLLATATALPELPGRIVSLTVGLSGIAALLACRTQLAVPVLSRLGYFSFAIYLLHVFATAPTRALLARLGTASDVVIFVASLVTGIALPVLFEFTAGRSRWVSWAVLGQRPYEPVRGRREPDPFRR